MFLTYTSLREQEIDKFDSVTSALPCQPALLPSSDVLVRERENFNKHV